LLEQVNAGLLLKMLSLTVSNKVELGKGDNATRSLNDFDVKNSAKSSSAKAISLVSSYL
jgi:hypothetical protein